MSATMSIEDVVTRMNSRLKLAAAAAREQLWSDLAPEASTNIRELIESSVSASLTDLAMLNKLLPFPISGYAGEPIDVWLALQARRFPVTSEP